MDVKVSVKLYAGMVFQKKGADEYYVVVTFQDGKFQLVSLNTFMSKAEPMDSEQFVQDLELFNRAKYVYLGGFWEMFEFQSGYSHLAVLVEKEGI